MIKVYLKEETPVPYNQSIHIIYELIYVDEEI